MMAVTPDDVLQIVPSMPRVSSPPFLSCAILRIWSWTIDSTSPGATRASIAGDGVEQAATGMKLMSATRNSSAGKEREEEIVGQLGREAQAVVCQHLAGRPLEQLPPTRGEL